MWFLRKNKVLLFLVMTLPFLSGYAQEKVESSFYFGIGGGYQSTQMAVSHLDKDVYPDSKGKGSGVFDFYLQYEFGRLKQFGVRLEVDFLKRGGILNNIYNTSAFPGLYTTEGISNIFYKLDSRFTDVRIPLIYQFGRSRSVLRPYLYVAPMVSFSTGGHIKSGVEFINGTYAGSSLEITKGNMRSVYFVGAVGVGLKYDLNLYGQPFYFTLEANYQLGLTDTYSSKEKSGDVVVKDNVFNPIYDITGTRRFNGFEIKGAISIPFSVFSRKKETPVTYYEQPLPPVEHKPEVVVVENIPPQEVPPCRSIEEIAIMMEKGENIHGVTFCSIDDIRFETGKSSIMPSSYEYLKQVATILKESGLHIEVMGHTDNVGSKDFNMELSRNRALAVTNFLKKLGVSADQLSYSYYGDSRPIRDNLTEEDRGINRRVEFEIK